MGERGKAGGCRRLEIICHSLQGSCITGGQQSRSALPYMDLAATKLIGSDNLRRRYTVCLSFMAIAHTLLSW